MWAQVTLKEKDKKKNADLERRVDDLQQYSRMDDLTVNGLETRHWTYARASARGKEDEDTPQSQLLSLEENQCDFTNRLPRKDTKTMNI